MARTNTLNGSGADSPRPALKSKPFPTVLSPKKKATTLPVAPRLPTQQTVNAPRPVTMPELAFAHLPVGVAIALPPCQDVLSVGLLASADWVKWAAAGDASVIVAKWSPLEPEIVDASISSLFPTSANWNSFARRRKGLTPMPTVGISPPQFDLAGRQRGAGRDDFVYGERDRVIRLEV